MATSRWILAACITSLLAVGGTTWASVSPAVGSDRSLSTSSSTATLDLLVEAMGTHRPKLAEPHASAFAAVLVAARGEDTAAVDKAWEAFAEAYFDDKTAPQRRSLKLLALAAALEHHTPKLAKAAAAAAKVDRARKAQAARIVVLERAVALAKSRAEPTERLTAKLTAATEAMQEMNMSFNLQYLQLQNNMQAENRQFTLMSNIMKVKHDTAKNAINNVR